MLHAYVRYRDVVLRVVRCLPDVAGAGGVKDKCVVEIPAHSAWRGLDPAPLRRHLRVVPIRVLRLGNHWCSFLSSRIGSLSIRRPRWSLASRENGTPTFVAVPRRCDTNLRFACEDCVPTTKPSVSPHGTATFHVRDLLLCLSEEKLAEQWKTLSEDQSYRTPGVVMRRGSSSSCHAGQETRAREYLHNEGVRAHRRSTAPRCRDLACIHAPRQSTLLRRSAHTVPLQP